MSSKPVIGVPADRRVLDPHPFHIVGEKYLHAVTKGADALPLLVPVLADSMDAADILASLDGIVLTGSTSNIEPHHYDGEPSRHETLHDPHRDALTLPLTRAAVEGGVPLLAICRGFQELNVALGGSLYQHVEEVEGYHSHKENPDDPLEVQYGPSHPISIVEGGLLHRLHGTLDARVNSLHSQGVRRLADGVTVEAVADDGLIEAFTVDAATSFALAVQWHPEWQVENNALSMEIFRAFGDAARERARQRKVKHGQQ